MKKKMSLAFLRQTDPNWHAYFFITDRSKFEEELLTTINFYNDSRLRFVNVDDRLKPEVTPTEFLFIVTNLSFCCYYYFIPINERNTNIKRQAMLPRTSS